MLSRCKCNQSEYIQIECFRVTNVFNLNTFKLNVFSFKGDDESSEDGLNVESEYSDEEQSAEMNWGNLIPKRQIIANICQWKYRSTECGYTGSNYWDINDSSWLPSRRTSQLLLPTPTRI